MPGTISSFHKAALVSGGGPIQPLSVPRRAPKIVEPLRQHLVIRNILNAAKPKPPAENPMPAHPKNPSQPMPAPMKPC
jgi:hypothetical protein